MLAINFYKHHLGDYDGATMHLSWDEDMAYTRLLRVYYRDEKPIPLEPKQAYRLVRAQSVAQRKAVDEVLKEFFERQVDGWHNKRADQEIAHAKASSESAKSSANARWAHNGRNANASPNAMRTHSEGNSNAMRTQCEGNAIQTPDSTIQTPDKHPPLTPPEEGPVDLELKRGSDRRERKPRREPWIPPESYEERQARELRETQENTGVLHASR